MSKFNPFTITDFHTLEPAQAQQLLADSAVIFRVYDDMPNRGMVKDLAQERLHDLLPLLASKLESEIINLQTDEGIHALAGAAQSLGLIAGQILDARTIDRYFFVYEKLADKALELADIAKQKRYA